MAAKQTGAGDAIEQWIHKAIMGQAPTTPTRKYFSMGQLESALGKLVDESNLPDKQSDRPFLIAAYKFLASAIRNRNAHYYAKNERDADFHRLTHFLYQPQTA
jgi:hypothetical protein